MTTPTPDQTPEPQASSDQALPGPTPAGARRLRRGALVGAAALLLAAGGATAAYASSNAGDVESGYATIVDTQGETQQPGQTAPDQNSQNGTGDRTDCPGKGGAGGTGGTDQGSGSAQDGTESQAPDTSTL
jgi:hypothetical protein